jgi:hypothetical protein
LFKVSEFEHGHVGMDGPRLSRIGIKPEGFYVIARIPNNKMKQKKLKKNSEYCSNFENKERVKMTRPVILVLINKLK